MNHLLNEMKYECVDKPASCPSCGSIKIATVQYGPIPFLEPKVYYLDTFSDFQLPPDIKKNLESGEIEFGGCIYGKESPSWRCKDCRTGIFKLKVVKAKE